MTYAHAAVLDAYPYDRPQSALEAIRVHDLTVPARERLEPMPFGLRSPEAQRVWLFDVPEKPPCCGKCGRPL